MIDPSADQASAASTEEGLGTAQTRSSAGTLHSPKLPGRETTSRVPSGLMLTLAGVSGIASRVMFPVERSSSANPSVSHQAIRSPKAERLFGGVNSVVPRGSSRRSEGPATSQTRRRCDEKLATRDPFSESKTTRHSSQ